MWRYGNVHFRPSRCPLCLASAVKCGDTGTYIFDPAGGVHSAWPQQSNVEIRERTISTQPVSTLLGFSSHIMEIREHTISTQPVSTLLGFSSHIWRYGNIQFRPSQCPLCLASAVTYGDTGTYKFDPAGVHSAWLQQSNVEIQEGTISTRPVSIIIAIILHSSLYCILCQSTIHSPLAKLSQRWLILLRPNGV
ncbi:hypothetical protein J6590_026541 [Homalodisca vitripennis]|nr:hypothetical protein J6590_026541 [Homalodisca vitripennis]